MIFHERCNAIACIVILHPQFSQRNKYFIMFFPSWVRFASMIDSRQNLTHSMMIVATLRYRYYPLTCSSEGWRREGRTPARRRGWGRAGSATWSLWSAPQCGCWSAVTSSCRISCWSVLTICHSRYLVLLFHNTDYCSPYTLLRISPLCAAWILSLLIPGLHSLQLLSARYPTFVFCEKSLWKIDSFYVKHCILYCEVKTINE